MGNRVRQEKVMKTMKNVKSVRGKWQRGVERLCEGTTMQIPFNADEINLIYQFGEQSKAEMCAHLFSILSRIKDSDTKQIVGTTLKKLNSLSEESFMELTATTKRWKLTECDYSIKVRLAKGKGDMGL